MVAIISSFNFAIAFMLFISFPMQDMMTMFNGCCSPLLQQNMVFLGDHRPPQTWDVTP